MLALAPHAPAAEKRAASPAAALAALAERYQEAQARMDPVHSGTLTGDNRFDDQLPITIAPAHRKKRFAMYRAIQAQLSTIARAALNPADALTHDLLARELRVRLEGEGFDDHLLPLQHLDSLPVMLAIFAGGQAEQPLKTVAQYDAYLRRLSGLPAWVEQAQINMREGMRRGIVLPKAVVAATLPILRPMGSATLADNPFHAPVRNLPASFSPAQRARLTEAYTDAVQKRIAPALRRFTAFVENDYLPAARSSAGFGALPNGDAWYRRYVRQETTTELTPDEIHAIGLAEVARIEQELARLNPQLGHDGDPRQLLAWVRTNPKFLPFRSEAEILQKYHAINETVKSHLPRLFGRAPKAALDIKPVPDMLKATSSDYYGVPAEDGSRPGIFWTVIDKPDTYNATTMTALFLHEGQPGHHFQLALLQELSLPAFRKRTWINAFGEGWALYAETLGHEMGLYNDPAAHVGQLRLEIARAARLVVDTGLHAQGWSREQAIAYWVDKVGSTEAQAKAQIERYMAWPGQALGYKIGSLKIQALRERARQKLGPRFDIAAFHDTVLAEGGLPLSLLDARIDRWIASQQ
jgi:uncharacterized protein (DUF885 family)